MACKYYYIPGLSNLERSGIKSTDDVLKRNDVYSAESVQGLLEQVLLNINAEMIEDDPSLIYYATSISPKEEMEIKLKKAFSESKGKTGKTISKLINETVLEKYRQNTGIDSKSEIMEKCREFQAKFGEAIHKCIQFYNTSEYGNVCDELNKLCLEAKKSDWARDGVRDIYFQPAVGNLFNKNSFTDHNWIDAFVKDMWNACEFNKRTPLFEQPIYYKAPNGDDLIGRIDAIYVTEDGTVHIFDFKTSASSRAHEIAEKQHYAQLYLYQQMLASYGIPSSKIKLHNAHITYDTGVVSTTARTGIERAYIFNPDSRENPSSVKAGINSMLRPWFPLRALEVTVAEERELSQKALRTKKSLFTEKALNRDEEENLTEYFKKIDENQPFKSAYLDSAVTLKVDGDDLEIKYLEEKRAPYRISLSEFVKLELQAQKEKFAELTDIYKTAIASHDIHAIEELMSMRGNKNLHIATQLGKYVNPDWEVVEHCELFNEHGIIVMYNTIEKCYDFISLVPNVNFDYVYHLNTDESSSMNILGNVCDQKDLVRYRDATMSAKISDIRILQTLITVVYGKDVLKKEGDDIKIGEIKVVSTTTGFGTKVWDYKPYIKQLYILADMATKNPSKVENGELFKAVADRCKSIQWSSTEEMLLQDTYGLWFSLPEDYDFNGQGDLMNHINEALSKVTLTDRIKKLEETQDSLRASFHSELSSPDAYKKSRQTIIQKIDNNLSAIIAALRGIATDQAFVTSGMGVDYNNSFRALRALVKNGDVSKFTPDGILLTGFLQGLSTATPYANPDDTVRMISQLHTYGTTEIQLQAEDIIESNNRATSEWLATKEEFINTLLIGNHRSLYQQLMEHDKNGQINVNFRFKNPFTDSTLTDADKKYLKIILWNKIRLTNSSLFNSNVRKKTFQDLSTSELETFKGFLEKNQNALNIPLRTASDARIVGNMLRAMAKGDWKSLKEQWHKKLEKSRNWWDPSGLTDKQLNEKEEKIRTMQTYNMYAESLTDRKKRLANNTLNTFEQNINFLMNDYVYSYVAVDVNRKILRSTDQAIAVLNIIQDYTGRDLSDQVEEIRKRSRISLYNSNDVPMDFKDLSGFVGHLRSLNNLVKIAGRPFLMAKELTLGKVKNYLYASMGYLENEGITLKAMTQADAIVFSEGAIADRSKKAFGKMKPGDRSKVEAINWLYRIANMDANILSQKTIADRYGFMNMGGDVLYYTNTRPDWYNRLSIVVAKMISDGCWDAHHLDEKNHLIYDMRKDERYSVYAKYRNNPPEPSDSNYKTYQKQKAKYNYALQAFQQIGITNKDGSALKEGDDLPMAYTPQETNSLKEVVGMLYGYYNHEEKTSFQMGTYANLFMAFKTYLAGELKHYFALPNGKTSRGKIAQITDGIPTAEHPEGSLLYEKEDPETGLITYVTNEYNEDGTINRPHMGWVANPTEGLVTSLLICMGDCFSAKGREDLRTNKARRRNAELFLLRMLIMSLFASVIALLLGNDDDEKTSAAALYAIDISQKVGNDLSFYHSVVEPVDDMGFVGVDYLQKLFRSTVDVLTDGDKEVQSLLYKNVQAVNDFKID